MWQGVQTACAAGLHTLRVRVSSTMRGSKQQMSASRRRSIFGFQAAFGGGGKFVGRAFMPDKHKPVYLYRYTTIKNVGHKCPTYLGLVFRLPLSGKQRQPENHIRATIGVKSTPRYLSPIAIKLALPPAAVVFTLHETS